LDVSYPDVKGCFWKEVSAYEEGQAAIAGDDPAFGRTILGLQHSWGVDWWAFILLAHSYE
jgi:hypothetical protein